MNNTSNAEPQITLSPALHPPPDEEIRGESGAGAGSGSGTGSGAGSGSGSGTGSATLRVNVFSEVPTLLNAVITSSYSPASAA